jgi:hypothetical protein
MISDFVKYAYWQAFPSKPELQTKHDVSQQANFC